MNKKNRDSTNEMLNHIEETYMYLLSITDEINEELEQRTLELIAIENEIKIALSNKEELYRITDMHDMLMERNDDFLNKLTTKEIVLDMIINKIENIELKGLVNTTYRVDNKPAIYRAIKEYNSILISEIYSKDNQFLNDYRRQLVQYMEYISVINIRYDYKIIPPEYKEVTVYNNRLRISYEDLRDYLTSIGYERERRNNTSHTIWKHVNTGVSIPLPEKSGTIPQGTVARILIQINKDRGELANYIYG